jgi:hypothetical protein
LEPDPPNKKAHSSRLRFSCSSHARKMQIVAALSVAIAVASLTAHADVLSYFIRDSRWC